MKNFNEFQNDKILNISEKTKMRKKLSKLKRIELQLDELRNKRERIKKLFTQFTACASEYE